MDFRYEIKIRGIRAEARARQNSRRSVAAILTTVIIAGHLLSACNFPVIGSQTAPLATPTAVIVLPPSGASPGEGTPLPVVPLVLPDSAGEINNLVWSENDGLIVLGGAEGITLLEADSAQPQTQSADEVQSQTIASAEPVLIADASQASIFAYSTIDNSIFTLDSAGQTALLQQDPDETPITGLAVSPDGTRVAYSTYDGSLTIAPSGEGLSAQVENSWDLPAWLTNLSFSPDGRMIGGADLTTFTIYLINSETGQEERILEWLESASASLYGIAFSNDWRRVAWVAQTGVQMMQVSDGTLGPLLNHADHVGAFVWSADSNRFATGSALVEGDEIRPAVFIWDTENGQLLETLPQPAAVKSLVFSPDGSQIAVLHTDGNLQIWNLLITD